MRATPHADRTPEASSPAGSHEQSDLATQVVAEAGRMSAGALTMVWWSLCSAMFYLFLGATLALTFGTRNALGGAVLAATAMSALGYVFSRYAIRSGRSCYLLSREMFGTAGASLATLIFAVTSVYYALFESSVVAVAASKVIPRMGYGSACMLIVAYSIALIAGSVQRWLDKLNGLLLPVYLLGLAAAVILAIRHYGYSNAWLNVGPPSGTPYGWWSCAMAYFGLQLLMMCTPVILTAWVGVALGYILADGRETAGDAGRDTSHRPPVFYTRGLVAWGASAASGLITMRAGGIVATLSVPVTLVVAFLGYWLPGVLRRTAYSRR
jgi:hypothetical protein